MAVTRVEPLMRVCCVLSFEWGNIEFVSTAQKLISDVMLETDLMTFRMRTKAVRSHARRRSCPVHSTSVKLEGIASALRKVYNAWAVPHQPLGGKCFTAAQGTHWSDEDWRLVELHRMFPTTGHNLRNWQDIKGRVRKIRINVGAEKFRKKL
jgi:hypothetical protein